MTDERRGFVVSAWIVAGGLLIGAGVVVGGAVSAAVIMSVFEAVAHAPVETRSEVLSEGIARAMWGGLGCLCSSTLLGGASMAYGVWRAYADRDGDKAVPGAAKQSGPGTRS